MGTADIQQGRLVELYSRYVGEPESMRDVYGYWIFLLGCIGVFGGVVMFLVGELVLSPTGEANYAMRKIAIPMASVGGVFGMLGILVLLPVRRRAMQVSLVGVAVALASLGPFWIKYPNQFNVDGATDFAPIVVGLYSAGVGIMVAIAALVPVVTGEKGLLVEPELGISDDSPPILIGDAVSDAIFAMFETDDHEWSWRVIRRDAVGEAIETLPSDTDAQLAIESVKEKIGDAGLLELTTAAFRLYRTEDDSWRWSLVREDGSVLAESEENLDTRDEAESTVNFLKEAAPAANVVEIRDAAFDVSRNERGRWGWRLIDDDRRPLAEDPEGYSEESAARSATTDFVDALGDARLLAFESVAIELFAEGDQWRWAVIDGQDRTLATAEDTFDSRRDAEKAANRTAGHVADANVIERGTPGFEVYEVGDEWQWRLRDETDDLIAASKLAAASEQGARSIAERVRDSVSDAEVIEFEGADYEVYPEDGEWHWRLVSEDRSVLADSTVPQDSLEDAQTAADRVREQALAADLIEFEQAAFQQYEHDGEWRWRLIDEDGQVMADSGEEYASRDEVMDGMTTLKEHAPDAEVLEIETAAFEIYQTDEGDYAWRLIDETGKLIAESSDTQPSRAAARDAVDFLLEHLDHADVRTMEGAIFQLGSGEGQSEWRWWLVDTDGSILAEGTEEFPTRDDARASIDDVREAGDGADIDTMGPVTVQLRNGSGWHFQLIDRDREPVATGERTYDGRDAAIDDVHLLTEAAADAPVFQLGDGVIWVDRNDEGWGWKLLDDEREPVAVSPERYETKEEVIDAVESVQASAPDAGTLDFDTMAYELFRDENDAWRWRLLDEKEQTRAISAGGFEHRDEVEASIEEARDTVGDASILEIDEAAFEFHQEHGGWIWRLVDENGEPLAESVEPHETRSEAREQMLAVKDHGPDGETVVPW